MAKIELFFGTPTHEKGILGNEEWAMNHEVSLEKANIDSFMSVLGVLTRKNEKDQDYFTYAFGSITGFDPIRPVITYGSYQFNKTKYPKITIHGDYLIDEEINMEVFISDEFIERIGKFIEDDFDYEFVEFKRTGKVKIKRNEIVYLIGGKPHFHHNGKFLEAKEQV